ncbi:MAG: hypothetical protein KBD64_05080, partial [Gammaproteobacteria bacterium]|nr:hypothetical protein [Gammaproteobacteria bacterium]
YKVACEVKFIKFSKDDLKDHSEKLRTILIDFVHFIGHLPEFSFICQLDGANCGRKLKLL